MQRRLRILLWRYRFVLAAGLLTLAVLAVLEEFRPAPAGEPVLVALTELPAGRAIRAGETGTAVLPSAPAGLAHDPVGLTPIVTIPAGVPVTESMLLGPGLSDHAPPGTVLAPVRVSDPSVLQLLRVGDAVDLYVANSDFSAGASRAELVAAGVQVMAIPAENSASGGLFSLEGTDSALFYGAIPHSDANLFTGASGLASFQVVIATR